jgi:hypothetical protein
VTTRNIARTERSFAIGAISAPASHAVADLPDRNEREAIAPLPPSPASPQWGSVASPSLDIAAGPATISRVGGGSSDSFGGFSLDDAQFSNADPNSDGIGTAAGQRA